LDAGRPPDAVVGLGIPPHKEDVVSNAIQLSRGDRNRNARLARLREALPLSNAVVGIDLADKVQALVVMDHESNVIARRRLRVRPWDLDPSLAWAAERARAAGFVGVTVACEPTGHRWQVVRQLATAAGMPMVCVSPMLVAHAREQEDLSPGKTDDRDATLIARLTVDRRCYLPEPADEIWGRLRQLGNRRARLVAESIACQHQLRDLLECAWPAVLDGPVEPLQAKTFRAALAVVLHRVEHGDLGTVHRIGRARFHNAVRREIPRWQGSRPSGPVLNRMFDALLDPRGVQALRPGTLERAGLILDDWSDIRQRLADVENRMRTVLDELNLTGLLATIPGLSLAGAASILAETGDPTRFSSGRALVKHAGLAPTERASGNYKGRTRVTGRGRPALRLAAWRAVWAAVNVNPVWSARFVHLTTREENPLVPLQARAALAAAMLRQLHAVVTHRVAWDPTVATGGRPLATAA
jgi:transposase